MKDNTPGEFWPIEIKEYPDRVTFSSFMPVEKPVHSKYVISIDNYDKFIFAFCLGFKNASKMQLLCSKTTVNEVEFIEEVSNLATFLNCPIIGDKSIDGALITKIIKL